MQQIALFLIQGEANECGLSLQGMDVDVYGGGVADDGGVVRI